MLRLIAVALACAAGLALAQPRDKNANQACFDAFEQTQGARRDGRLIEARDAAIVCSADACPRTISKECVKWVSELQPIIPGLVFDVRLDDDSNITDVAVNLDGKQVLSKLDGKALPVDPGEHSLSFFTPGFPPIETKVVALEGDKARRVQVTFRKPGERPPIVEAPGFRMKRPVPLATWIVGGLSLATLAVAGVVGLVGLSQRGQLESCKPSCDPVRVVNVGKTLAVADGLFIGGLVTAAATAVIFFTRPEIPVPLVSLVPLREGAGVSLGGTF